MFHGIILFLALVVGAGLSLYNPVIGLFAFAIGVLLIELLPRLTNR